MSANGRTTEKMIVATWPGTGQEYISRFCESLEHAGIEVRRIEEPWQALSTKIDVFHIHWPEKVFLELQNVKKATSSYSCRNDPARIKGSRRNADLVCT